MYTFIEQNQIDFSMQKSTCRVLQQKYWFWYFFTTLFLSVCILHRSLVGPPRIDGWLEPTSWAVCSVWERSTIDSTQMKGTHLHRCIFGLAPLRLLQTPCWSKRPIRAIVIPFCACSAWNTLRDWSIESGNSRVYGYCRMRDTRIKLQRFVVEISVHIYFAYIAK